MKKRLLCVFTSLFILAGVFSGCTKKTQQTVQNTQPQTKGTNEYGWQIPVNTIEFSYYLKGKGNPDKAKEIRKDAAVFA